MPTESPPTAQGSPAALVFTRALRRLWAQTASGAILTRTGAQCTALARGSGQATFRTGAALFVMRVATTGTLTPMVASVVGRTLTLVTFAKGQHRWCDTATAWRIMSIAKVVPLVAAPTSEGGWTQVCFTRERQWCVTAAGGLR